MVLQPLLVAVDHDRICIGEAVIGVLEVPHRSSVSLRFEAFPSKVGDGEVCLARVHGFVRGSSERDRREVPGPAVVADDLLQRFDFAGIAEPGVRLPVEITWARDVRTIRLHADAGGAVLKWRDDGRRGGAGCTGERGLTLCADAELGIAGIDQGVGRGVVVRQDRDVQAGVLEVALLECYVQTGVVRVRCPVECEPNGPVGRAGVRGASGQNCERGCDRGRRGKRAAQRRKRHHDAGQGCWWSAESQNISS